MWLFITTAASASRPDRILKSIATTVFHSLSQPVFAGIFLEKWQPHDRRRRRVNAHIKARHERSIRVSTMQSIERRTPLRHHSGGGGTPGKRGARGAANRPEQGT